MKTATETPTPAMDNLPAFCEGVMRGVAALINQSGRKPVDYQQAVDVLIAEMKDFFFDERWANERLAVIEHRVNQNVVIASLCLSCLSKIKLQPKTS